MKTLTEFKDEYSRLLASECELKDKKERKKAQSLAKKLHDAIRWLEIGVTEDSLRKQLAGVRRTMKILDERFTQQNDIRDIKEWKKVNGYAAMRRSISVMMWVLKY